MKSESGCSNKLQWGHNLCVRGVVSWIFRTDWPASLNQSMAQWKIASKKQSGGHLRRSPKSDFWFPHTCTMCACTLIYTHIHQHTHVCTNTHTQRNNWDFLTLSLIGPHWSYSCCSQRESIYFAKSEIWIVRTRVSSGSFQEQGILIKCCDSSPTLWFWYQHGSIVRDFETAHYLAPC